MSWRRTSPSVIEARDALARKRLSVIEARDALAHKRLSVTNMAPIASTRCARNAPKPATVIKQRDSCAVK